MFLPPPINVNLDNMQHFCWVNNVLCIWCMIYLSSVVCAETHSLKIKNTTSDPLFVAARRRLPSASSAGSWPWSQRWPLTPGLWWWGRRAPGCPSWRCFVSGESLCWIFCVHGCVSSYKCVSPQIICHQRKLAQTLITQSFHHLCVVFVSSSSPSFHQGQSTEQIFSLSLWLMPG